MIGQLTPFITFLIDIESCWLNVQVPARNILNHYGTPCRFPQHNPWKSEFPINPPEETNPLTEVRILTCGTPLGGTGI